MRVLYILSPRDMQLTMRIRGGTAGVVWFELFTLIPSYSHQNILELFRLLLTQPVTVRQMYQHQMSRNIFRNIYMCHCWNIQPFPCEMSILNTSWNQLMSSDLWICGFVCHPKWIRPLATISLHSLCLRWSLWSNKTKLLEMPEICFRGSGGYVSLSHSVPCSESSSFLGSGSSHHPLAEKSWLIFNF